LRHQSGSRTRIQRADRQAHQQADIDNLSSSPVGVSQDGSEINKTSDLATLLRLTDRCRSASSRCVKTKNCRAFTISCEAPIASPFDNGFTTNAGEKYDTGDYEKPLNRALDSGS
jgi:hypothetical protein